MEPGGQNRDPEPAEQAAQVRSLFFKTRTLWDFETENDTVRFCLKSTLPAEWEADMWKMSDQEPCGYLWSNSRTWSGTLHVGTWPGSHLGTLQGSSHVATGQPGCQALLDPLPVTYAGLARSPNPSLSYLLLWEIILSIEVLRL